MHEPMGEIAVGCEDHETFAIFIETTGAKKTEAREFAGQNGEDRIWIVRIVIGAHETTWFVHGQGDSRLGGGADRFAARRDSVDARRNLLTKRGSGTVDPHLTLRNQGFGGPS